MKKLIAFLFPLLLIVPAAALGQTNVVLLPYGSGGYKYQFAQSTSSTITSGIFYTNGWNESGCSSNGVAAFGTLNSAGTPPCLLNDATHIKTIWPTTKDLIVRKRVTVPAGAQNVRVKVAIDDGVSVWWNGTNISGGIRMSNDCATENGNFIFTVPAALVKTGENILTARGVWVNQKNYLDMQVLCDRSFTITASAGANGSISPAGAVSVPAGTNKAFNITANPGYHVASIKVDGVTTNVETSTSTPPTYAYTFPAVSANHTISATFASNVYTITATAGLNGSISPAGAVSVPHGTNKAFNITANPGYHVASITVDGVTSNVETSPFTPPTSSYTFPAVNANHTISAAFALNVYTITASAGANGLISPAGAVSVPHGSNQPFDITANPGYHVASITVDGVTTPIETSPFTPPTSSYNFTAVSANHTISASFALNVYTITASAGANGLISPAGAVSVPHGSNQPFDITANPGYHVASITVDGVTTPIETSPFTPPTSSYNFTAVSANHTISASFDLNVYTITATAGANGAISPVGAVSVPHGSNQGFNITADTGYHVASITVDGVTTTIETSPFTPPTSSYTFPAVGANHTISATFGLNQYAITATAGANGAISPAGLVNVPHGADKSFDITADTGYHVLSVTIDGVTTVVETSLKTPAAYSTTFPDVAANHTITAAFAINQYTFTAIADSNGNIPPEGDTTVTHGDEQSYTIVADEGYHVHSITVDGVTTVVATSAQAPAAYTYTFPAATADHTISAAFAINVYAVTASAGPNGSFSPAGPINVEHGGSAAFTAVADTHYHVGTVQIDADPAMSVETSVSTPRQYEYAFTDVTSDRSIAATFAGNQYVLSVHVDTEPSTGDTTVGHVVVSPEQALYAPDADVTLTAFAADGQYFVKWLMPGGAEPTDNPIAIQMSDDMSITAIYAPKTSGTIVVNTIEDTVDPDDGLTSLREAFDEANGSPGDDEISFDIVEGSTPGAKVIGLNEPLPPFTDGIVLDFSDLLDGEREPPDFAHARLQPCGLSQQRRHRAER